MFKCPRCGEELEELESGYCCQGLAGCFYYEAKEQSANLPTEPIELNADKYKTTQLLKEKFPDGYKGYKLQFRITEFLPVNKRGKRKFLHVHVVVKKGKKELLEVRVPTIPLIIEYENHHEKQSIRNEWKRIIRNNMADIMNEIKVRLAQFGISLSDWEIENY